MTAATLAIAGAFAAAASAGGHGVPDRNAVLASLDRRHNPGCESVPAPCARPRTLTIRALRCRAESEDRALCRYERRLAWSRERRISLSNPPPERWEAAEARLTHDNANRSWTVERESMFEPTPENVESALSWEEGRSCRTLIDACLDEDGNDLFELPDFKVSDLLCRGLVPDRAACSFTSVRIYGTSRETARSCSGTLQNSEGVYGGNSWIFASGPRRVNSALLRCE